MFTFLSVLSNFVIHFSVQTDVLFFVPNVRKTILSYGHVMLTIHINRYYVKLTFPFHQKLKMWLKVYL